MGRVRARPQPQPHREPTPTRHHKPASRDDYRGTLFTYQIEAPGATALDTELCHQG